MNFESDRIWLYAGEDTITNRGVLVKVKEVLKPRRLRFGWFSKTGWSWLFGSIIGVFLEDFIEGIIKETWLVIVVGIAFGLIFVVWVFWAMNIQTKRYSLIILKRRHEQESFWKRNKDKIIVALIASLISGILGVGGTLLIQLLTKM
ncbi:hypothetical protein GX441_06075 [bacterium]|nr:hypothetical protein [bacterium]